MLGLLSFESVDRSCGIFYYWEFRNSTLSTFHVYLEPSVRLSGVVTLSACALDSMTTNIFYLKHWICDPPYSYFNYTSALCQIECWDYATQDVANDGCQECQFNCFNCD